MLKIKTITTETFHVESRINSNTRMSHGEKERTKGSDYFKVKEDAKVTLTLLKQRQNLRTPNLSE
jgi:hypothetical protein